MLIKGARCWEQKSLWAFHQEKCARAHREKSHPKVIFWTTLSGYGISRKGRPKGVHRATPMSAPKSSQKGHLTQMWPLRVTCPESSPAAGGALLGGSCQGRLLGAAWGPALGRFAGAQQGVAVKGCFPQGPALHAGRQLGVVGCSSQDSSTVGCCPEPSTRLLRVGVAARGG